MNRLTCDQVRDNLLERWLDGGLDPETAGSIRDHVESCAECLQEKEALEAEAEILHGALMRVAEERRPSLNTAKVVNISIVQPLRRRILRPVWLGLAASFVLAMVFVSWEKIIPTGTNDLPTVELASVEAKPGDQVIIPVRAKNLVGLCGLKARIRFDSRFLEVQAGGESLGQIGVKGNEITIAALSADGWRDSDGIAFKLPVTVRQTVPPKTVINLEIVAVDVTDSRNIKMEASPRDGSIHIL
jgi:hypothetical protein